MACPADRMDTVGRGADDPGRRPWRNMGPLHMNVEACLVGRQGPRGRHFRDRLGRRRWGLNRDCDEMRGDDATRDDVDDDDL